MTIRLYLTPLPETTSETAADQIGSDIQQAGLLDTGGTAVENIATENVDFQKRGRIQFGPTLSRKAAEELDSLSESSYTALPLYSSDGSLARKRGYYEVTRADVEPAQESRDDVYQYDVQLANAGTREDSRRAVRTNPQAVDSVYPDASAAALVAIPDSATDVRWYDDANGTEPATAVETAQAEFGTVARYDPADATADAPALTYDLAFDDDGPVDVRVYDTKDQSKLAATASGSEVNRWTHAYHTGYQFDGAAVFDTGVFRLVLDGNLEVVADEYGERVVATGETDVIQSSEVQIDRTLTVESGGTFRVESGGVHQLTDVLRSDFAAAMWDSDDAIWRPVSVDPEIDTTLRAWSITRLRPARVEVMTLWSDGTTESRLKAVIERGASGVAWIVPENATSPSQELTSLLSPVARDTDTLAFGTQGLIHRDTRDA
jgi:hypothetical protein